MHFCKVMLGLQTTVEFLNSRKMDTCLVSLSLLSIEDMERVAEGGENLVLASFLLVEVIKGMELRFSIFRFLSLKRIIFYSLDSD